MNNKRNHVKSPGSNGKTKLTSLLKYAGNKQNLMDQIRPFFNWEGVERYIEPFAGAMGSAFNANIPQGVACHLSDVNDELINFYDAVRSDPAAVEELSNSWACDEVTYYSIRSWDKRPNWKNETSCIERAARTIYLNRRGFNGLYRINRKGYFTTPWGHNTSPAPIEITQKTDFLEFLASATVYCSSWQAAVEGGRKGDLIYCDPPYVDIKNPTEDFGGYVGNFGMKEQEALRDNLLLAAERGARVVISNSYCDATLHLYEGWNVEEIFATRRLGSNTATRGRTPEVLAWLPSSS